MDKYTFVTNNCLGQSIYNTRKQLYDNPFIGSYIQDDDQFLKLCLNYEYYITCVPVFSKPLQPMDTNYPPIPPGSYPVMFLDDIEIHWIHEKDSKHLLQKYQRRLQRSKSKIPFFVWGDALLHRPHTDEEREQLIVQFNSIPNSVYFRKEDISEWKNKSFSDRNNVTTGWARPLNWLNFQKITELVHKHFEKNI